MVEKKGQKIRAGAPPPPLFGQCPKENIFFQEVFPRLLDVRSTPFLYLYLSLCVTLSSPDDSRCCFVSNNVMGPT